MNRQELEYYSRRYGLIFLLSLAMVAFLLPLILRVVQGAPITPGAESYSYTRRADLLAQGIISQDPLSGAYLAPEPYIALLSVMGIFGVPWMLPLLLAVLFIVLLYFYMEQFVPLRSVIVLALTVLIVSPVMSVLATHHTGTLLALDLLIAALIIVDSRPALASVLIGLMIIALPVLGLISALYAVIVLLRDGKHHAVIGIMLAIAVASAWFLVWTGTLPYELSAVTLHTDLFFELGNDGGMTIFALMLALYAIILKFDRLQSLIVPSLILFALTFFMPALMPLSAVAIALFAGHAIFLLITNQWELELLRESLIVLIACIGIFLLITTVRERVDDRPDADFAHMMTNLRTQYREGAVLTDPSYAPMIEHFTGKRAAARSVVPPEMFSRDPAVVYPYLERTGTSYILITDEMEADLFSHREQGILFFLQNSGRFVQIAETEEATLWYYIKI